MTSDKAFVRQRFAIVEVRLKTDLERQERIQLQREHRLLGKLLDEAAEGQVLRTLQAWRRYLGGAFAQYRQAHRTEREVFDNWWRLPADQRADTPKPESPSLGTEVTDRNGYVWIVDDRFLAMMDDLIARLRKWLENGD
ncbi:MAG: hypothetical protein AB1791_22275 [Chloroflexota bacterium]